ncbi:MAG TPA: type II toxin-antitoxin system antitoxin SocA domain-containing protein [Asticcacaulis sp.]|nr:type II toxin-antitoxin system antitoxin SocA domain-containing protein [Asticcacaulis sp.]
MSRDIRSIANFLLDEADRRGLAITNMALNKILYFAQGWYLATKKRELFLQDFEAWEMGPVSPVIYQQFKSAGSNPIKDRAKTINLHSGSQEASEYSLSREEEGHLIRMLEFYGHRSAAVLSHMSHEQGAPWDMVRNSDGYLGMKIPNGLIKAFFESKLTKKFGGDA